MLAHIDAVSFVETVLLLFLRFRPGNCTEYLFQGTCPALKSLLHRDHHIPVFKGCLICHLADNRIRDGELPNLSFRHFSHNISKSRGKQIPLIHIVFNLNTHMVTKCHLAHCRRNALGVYRIGGDDLPGFHILKEFSVLIHDLFVFGKIIRILLNLQKHQLASRLLQFRCNDML